MDIIKRVLPSQLVREEANSLELETVASAFQFRRLIENAVGAVLGGHNRHRRMTFNISYSESDQMTACTDNTMCYINAGNQMFRENPDDAEKKVSIKESLMRLYGAAFHEIGHVLYTCFSEMKRMGALFSSGNLDVPSDELTGDFATYYDELQDVLQNDKAVVLQGFFATPVRDFIISIYMNIMNCVEDGRIENLLLKNDNRFSGLYAGLNTLREYHQKTLENIDVSEHDIPAFTNLVLMYAKYKTVGKYTGGFKEFDMAMPIIDKMLETHQAQPFAQLNLKLILCIWPQIKNLILEIEGESSGQGNGEGEDGDGEQNDSQSGGKGSGNSQGSSQNSNSQGSSEGEDGSENSESKSEGSNSNEGNESSEGSSKGSAQEELEKKLNEILEQIAQNMPKEESNQNDAGETEQKEKEASVSNSAAPREDNASTSLDATLGDIMKQLADERVREKAAEDACQSVRNTIASAGRGFAPYLGTDVLTMSPISGASLDDNTEAAIKKAAREITRHLEQDMRVGVSKRKFSGKKFHAEKVCNRDFRYFENKRTAKEVPQVKVGLVVDESGSMHSSRRYEYARAAAKTLYRIFEYVPNLDIAIYGHSTRGEVQIYDYADFGIKPNDVEDRLNNINARGGNIDIVPVTAMAENLLKQDAQARVMFIITDGLPYSYVRNMTPEQELSEAADNYSRKGIDIIVASIGDDEERLRTIYKNQKFLNISNPSELPRKVVDVIKRKM